MPLDIARVYASDAADRLAHSAVQVVCALAEGTEAERLVGGVRRLARHAPFNSVVARRRISDAVVRAGRYPL